VKQLRDDLWSEFELCVSQLLYSLFLLTSLSIFNQYDPAMLERLSYDDKLTDVVRSQSNGRPSYCESRYYRAIANGGQGKNMRDILCKNCNQQV